MYKILQNSLPALRWCFLLLGFVLSSGCGGGGGGTPAPTPTPSATLSLVDVIVTEGDPNSRCEGDDCLTYQYDSYSTRMNESVTLTWSSNNASSCSASGDWSGSKSTSGSESFTVPERGTKTYTLSCGGSGGSVNSSVELGVLCVHSDVSDGTLVSSLEELKIEISRIEGDGIDDKIYLQSGTYVLDEDSPIIYHARGTVEKISIIGCHPDDVVIDGALRSHIFHFYKSDEETLGTGWTGPFPSLYLEGFTVKNGVRPWGENAEYEEVFALGLKGTEAGGLGSGRFIGKIKNMKFLNNQGAFHGTIGTEILDSYFALNRGAITSFGSLTIKHSTFLENFSSGFIVNGGFFLFQQREPYASILVTTKVFLEDGSVVDGNDLSFVIEDSTFTGGRGVIVLRDRCDISPCGTASIKNSIFQELGRVPLWLYVGIIDISGSSFLNNTAGGGLTIHPPGYCVHAFYVPCSSGGGQFGFQIGFLVVELLPLPILNLEIILRRTTEAL